MKKKGWLWILLAAVVGIVAGGYWLYRNGAGAQNAALAAGNGQDVAVVERRTLRVSVEGSGNLAPQDEVAVSFKSGGKVTAIWVEEGDAAPDGGVLVQLNDSDARRNVAKAELQVQQSQASLESAQLNLNDLLTWTPDASAVELAQANLDAAQADYDKTVAGNASEGAQLVATKVQVDQAYRALADAQEAYNDAYDPKRDWELGDRFRSGMLATERKNAESNLLRAQEDLKVAQAEYTLQAVGLGNDDVKSAWSQVVNARVALENEQTAPDAGDIEAARIQVEEAEITLAQSRLQMETAQRTLADLTLTAPVAGIVTTMNAKVGQMMGASQTTVVLADLSTLSVEIGLNESDIVQVAVGQPAIVTLDAFAESELSGVITYIAPTAQAQSGVVLYAVTVALDPTSLPIRAGMTADVEITTDSSAGDALIVPLKAVRSLGGRNFVLRQLREGETAPTLSNISAVSGTMAGAANEQTTAQAQALRSLIEQGFTPVLVELGVVSDNYVVVTGDLEEGDVISLATAAENNANASTGGQMGMPGFRGLANP